MENGTYPLAAFIVASGLAFATLPAVAGSDCGKAASNIENSPRYEKHLHDALKLTPQQEGAWQKYVQTLRQQPAGKEGKRADWSTLSAPERAERDLEADRHDLEYRTQLVAGMKSFYGGLTPEQQKTFDRFHGGPQSDQR